MFSQEEKMVKTRNAQNEYRLELKRLMLDRENLDYDKIKAVLSKMSESRQNQFIERLKNRDAISKVLTPEQQDALKNLTRDRLQRGRDVLRNRNWRRNPRFNRFKRDSEDPIR